MWDLNLINKKSRHIYFVSVYCNITPISQITKNLII